jgi:hypothetical protein
MQCKSPGNGISYHTLSFNSQALLVYLAALQQRPAIYSHRFLVRSLWKTPSPEYFPLPLSILPSFIHARVLGDTFAILAEVTSSSLSPFHSGREGKSLAPFCPGIKITEVVRT